MHKLRLAGAVLLFLLQGASAHAAQTNAAATSGVVALSGSGNLVSQIVGLDVYNQSNQRIGQIEDIAVSEGGKTQAYILAVAHSTGLTPRYVAVDPSAVKIGFSDTDKTLHAQMNASLDQLIAAPEYQYSGRVAEKACVNILRF